MSGLLKIISCKIILLFRVIIMEVFPLSQDVDVAPSVLFSFAPFSLMMNCEDCDGSSLSDFLTFHHCLLAFIFLNKIN